MTKFVAVVSAKGGVGKTTTTINLSSALDWFKRDVIVLDANFTNPDVGIYLGAPFKEKTFHTALKGNHHIKESIYRHPSGLKIISGNISFKEAVRARRENIVDVIQGLTNLSEIVLIDSSPGIGGDCRAVLKAVDYVLVITTPDVCSVANTIKIINLAKEYNKQILGIVVNKHRGEEYELDTNNIQTMTGQKVIGIIPQDSSVRLSMHNKNPLLITHPEGEASIGFKKLASQLIGEQYVVNIEKEPQKTNFKDIIRRFGF
ncbi:MAG: P-loop NTPase [Candidatus Nanoarchaeia archaeon]